MKKILFFLLLLIPICLFAQQKPPVKSPKKLLDTLWLKDPATTSGKILEVLDTAGNIHEYGELVNGEKEGLWRTYFDNHVLYTLIQYHNGKKNGYSNMTASDGMIMKEENYKDDVLDGPSRIYNRNGKMKFVENYAEGKEVGRREAYYPEGNLQEEGFLNKDGNRDSINRWYYNNGKLMVEYVYKNGNIDGPSKSYYESGKLKTDGLLKDNAESGHWKEYADTTGTIKAEGDYLDGKKTGAWKLYDKEGTPVKTQEYKDGTMIEEKAIKPKKS